MLRNLCGPHHRNLERLEQRFEDFSLRAESQGGGIMLFGAAEGVAVAETALGAYMQKLLAGTEPGELEFEGAINTALTSTVKSGGPVRGLKSRIQAQTAGQTAYLSALQDETAGLVFGVGPAGTGKTFLAVATGAAELVAGKRERLIVARPAVEAGEKLGFLPGDLEDKVDPYMLPIWDSLRELFGQDQLDRRRLRGEIEVAPLAFMRGRTLKNAFIIIDEAQNASIPQMKMVLTRLGRNSRMVVTGDPSQVDLPSKQPSGLPHALHILRSVPGVRQMRLTASDVVRHDLVSRIVDAYDRAESGSHDDGRSDGG
ncbi:MAG: phosphate starvation-inducible protein PhoH [Ponticaulis sp.]|nr:phosphate starvation-inducible protein PhoH [Ponticaulis sp.]|tara:strand:+ start:98611 stop:99552 length:942 start_codon:yes stop_codon:yes gene_type:complete